MPIPAGFGCIMSTYAALKSAHQRIIELEAEVELWKAKAESNWETLECVAIGERLECPKCGKPRPCCCQDLG